MTGDLRREPPPIDTSSPHPARIHDYLLGGGHNFAADRELAEKLKAVLPAIEDVVRMNQSFIRRAALFLIESGIRQFLDVTTGLPGVGTLHEIVHRVEPDCHVVYVDPDPVVVAHNTMKLRDNPNTGIIQADMRDVDAILGSEVARRHFDPDQPLALMAAMLHFISDDWDPAGIIAGYRDRLPSGSYLSVVNVAGDNSAPGVSAAADTFAATSYPVYPRSRAEIMRICAGFELVEPGLVGLAQWRPERPGDATGNPDVDSVLYGAVGRKP